jgi:TRAP transporter TAXI family solute receptor
MKRRNLLATTVAIALGAPLARAFAAPPAHWPKSLTLGTASVGGTYFVYGQAWASLVSEKIGVPISTQQTQGPNQNIILVQDRQVELGMTTMGIALQAWEGTGAWTNGRKFRDIRAMFPMYDTPFHFVTLERSGIRSVAQLDGKRVGVGPRAGTPGTYFPMMFEALGLKVTIVNGQAADMAGQLADGLIDCFAFAAGLPIAAFSELEATQKVAFFGFTKEEIAKLKAKFPELSDAVIPAGTYKTLRENQATLGIFNFSICHKSLPDDLVEAIVAAIFDNHEALVKGHAAAAETVLANVGRNTFLPFHPGAVKYYRSKGIEIPAALIGT